MIFFIRSAQRAKDLLFFFSFTCALCCWCSYSPVHIYTYIPFSILCYSFRLSPLLFSLFCLCAQAFLFFFLYYYFSFLFHRRWFQFISYIYYFYFFPSFLFMMPCLFKLRIQRTRHERIRCLCSSSHADWWLVCMSVQAIEVLTFICVSTSATTTNNVENGNDDDQGKRQCIGMSGHNDD